MERLAMACALWAVAAAALAQPQPAPQKPAEKPAETHRSAPGQTPSVERSATTPRDAAKPDERKPSTDLRPALPETRDARTDDRAPTGARTPSGEPEEARAGDRAGAAAGAIETYAPWLVAWALALLLTVAARTALAFLQFYSDRRVGAGGPDRPRGSAIGTLRSFEATMRKQARAYIHVTGSEARGLESGDPVVWIEWRNAGQTPASDITMWCVLDLLPVDATEGFVEGSDEASLGALGPGGVQGTSKRGTRRLTDEEMAQLRAGEVAIFLYGAIRYADVFAAVHTTRFRVRLGDANGLGADARLRFCRDGNAIE